MSDLELEATLAVIDGTETDEELEILAETVLAEETKVVFMVNSPGASEDSSDNEEHTWDELVNFIDKWADVEFLDGSVELEYRDDSDAVSKPMPIDSSELEKLKQKASNDPNVEFSDDEYPTFQYNDPDAPGYRDTYAEEIVDKLRALQSDGYSLSDMIKVMENYGIKEGDDWETIEDLFDEGANEYYDDWETEDLRKIVTMLNKLSI